MGILLHTQRTKEKETCLQKYVLLCLGILIFIFSKLSSAISAGSSQFQLPRFSDSHCMERRYSKADSVKGKSIVYVSLDSTFMFIIFNVIDNTLKNLVQGCYLGADTIIDTAVV